jgi:hypothetical protein
VVPQGVPRHQFVIAQNREYTSETVLGVNTYARTRYVNADLVFRFVFLKMSRIRPHIGLGAGFLNFSIVDEQARNLDTRTETRARDETYTTTALYLPVVLGARLRVNDFASILLEYKQFNTNTDYLDNIGQAGNRAGNDRLHSVQLGLLLTPSLRNNRPRVHPI